jgi:hypothetical protein
MFISRTLLLGALIFLPGGYLKAEMAVDMCSTGTTLVSGTTLHFMANGFGSGNCHNDPNLIFANVSPSDWSNLLITATLPAGFTPPVPCDPDLEFLHCTVVFNSSTEQYSAFFFGVDLAHPGIQISTLSEDGRTNEFGFVFDNFPANQTFNASANVPEPFSFGLMLTGIAVVGAISVRNRLALPACGRRERPSPVRASVSPR